MKVLLTIITVFFSLYANATNYYFSASGADANAGTIGAPWKTIAKFNTVFSTRVPGDSLLFRRGDLFSGKITISRSGVAGAPIVIGAYGTGASPIITGLASAQTWTLIAPNIWETTTAISTTNYTNMVVINGVNTPMGRYPNTGYLTFTSHTFNSVTSSSLNSLILNWTGAEAGISNTPFNIIRVPIISAAGTTITYTNNKSIIDTLYNTPGTFYLPNFIIQNDPRTLDALNEWYYSPTTKKLRVYSTVSPTGVQVATVDTLVYLSGRSYITFTNLSFTGANMSAIQLNNSPHIVIKNCDFDFSGRNAINGASNSSKVESCTFNHTNNNAIDFATATPDTVRLNTIRNTGMIVMGMKDGSSQAEAITTRGNAQIIEYNNIDSTGFCGIRYLGSNILIQNNFVNHSCMLLYDGGSIYTFNSGSLTRSGTRLLNNIVLNTPTKNGAIYLDDRSNGILIQGNTCAFAAIGIYLHNAWNVQVLNNTVYGNVDNMESNWNDVAITQNNLTIKNNIFFAKNSTDRAGNYYTENTATMPLPFTADSNYYARPINDNLTIQTVLWPSTVTQRSLAMWQTLNSPQESHSLKSPRAITNVSQLDFQYNATSASAVKTLAPGVWVDVRNANYSGTITLQPYTSAVLINTGVGNISPIASAGTNKQITLPTNFVSQTGSGTDQDGTIVSYLWTQVSGPGTAIFSAATSATTNISSLIAGLYTVQLRVTDNLGATGTATATITVSPTPPANISPVASAGGNKNVTLPVSTVTQAGSGTDQDGTISSYSWAKTSGPATFTIVSPASATTAINNLVQGTYVFTLTVTDNLGATGTAIATVIVNPAVNQLPSSGAGADQALTYPASTATLTGTASDPDGSIISYNWTKITGAGGTINSPSTLSTTLTNLSVGVYLFQLLVTDNSGGQDSDRVQVTVNAGAATLSVPNATVAYTGLQQRPVTTTNPAGLSYDQLFNGISLVPTDPGVYDVLTGVSDANYIAAPVSSVFTITKGTAVITARDSSVFYDGQPHEILASVTYPGTLIYTYNGSLTKPINSGTYSVHITMLDSFFVAAALNVTLTISLSPASIFNSGLSKIYNTFTQAVTVTTNPAGLAHTTTYNGSGTPPIAPGTYTVVSTITAPGYSGTDTDIMTIAQATPVVTWNRPATIPLGTTLTSLQLNATATVPGQFVYTPPLLATLNVGTQPLSVQFIPTDPGYRTVIKTTSIRVDGNTQSWKYFYWNGTRFFIKY